MRVKTVIWVGRNLISFDPLLKRCGSALCHLEGPCPADTAFKLNLSASDCHIAMYHDQGLPVKYQGFGDSVNITLGLRSFERASTMGLLNLAGRGLASTGGLVAAIREANRLTAKIA